MHRLVWLVLLPLFLLAIAGCQAERSAEMAEEPVAEYAVASPQAPARAGDETASPRMLIRTANVSIVVDEPSRIADEITKRVTDAGGFISDSNRWREGDQFRVSLVIRVPATRLDATLSMIRSLAIRVERESVSGQDVTAEYTDLGSRLKNLEATEVELRELLTTVRQRTQKASEVMEVYQELTRIRGEIEQIKGRRQVLEQLTSLSTINLELIPDALASPLVEPGWRPRTVVHAATRALISTLRIIAEVLIWVVIYILPLGILILIAYVLIARIRRSFSRKRKTDE